MNSKLSNWTIDYPFYSGSLCLIIAVVYFIYKISIKESFKMRDYSAAGWLALVNSWALIFMLLILGLFLIFE
jgi:hypothetical protein